MSVFKKIDSNDSSVTSFDVHKKYTVTPTNYSGSNGLGVHILAATMRSSSFADPINGGTNIDEEDTNPNGTYKTIIYDSINHLYYTRENNPGETFGGNLPEKQDRFLGEKAHVISIPSPLYDLKIKTGSVRILDHYVDSFKITKHKALSGSSSSPRYSASMPEDETVYVSIPLLANQYRFIDSQSKFACSELGTSLSDARPSDISQVYVVTKSVNWNDMSQSLDGAKVGTGSLHMKVTGVDSITDGNGNVTHLNAGNGIMVRQAGEFKGTMNDDWWQGNSTNFKSGMPAYTVTMWIKPPDWNKMPNRTTGAKGRSTIITRDRNSYFELQMISSSYETNNPKGLVPLQMFWGATGSNCTTSASQEAISTGLSLATGSWNLVTIQQEFWPGDADMGTSGSHGPGGSADGSGGGEGLPSWAHSPAKTTLRIYRPDPAASHSFTYSKFIGYATKSLHVSGTAGAGSGIPVNDGGSENLDFPWWHNQTDFWVTSSNQYARNMYIGASGSVAAGAANNQPTSQTIYEAFTGSIDDIRFYESVLTDTQVALLWQYPYMDLRMTPPVTASFVLRDDSFGNIIDTGILSSSFVTQSRLVAYYGFNNQYRILNQTSGSPDLSQHQGFGKAYIEDETEHKNTATSDKVKFVPGIAVTVQSGSVESANSLNFYHTDVHSGIAAKFFNSGSIRIPHKDHLNLNSEDGWAISFWANIPEAQIPGINTITGSDAYLTTGETNYNGMNNGTGNAGGTSKPCVRYYSGSIAGRDYVTLITKTGLGTKTSVNSATGGVIVEETTDDMERAFPYKIQLKNTSLEQNGKPFGLGGGCNKGYGAQLNTIVVRRSDGQGHLLLESKTALTPLIDNHIVVTKNGTTLQIWINGKLDADIQDKLNCTDNTSDVFLGDEGQAWATGSDVGKSKPYPRKPYSGSLDELRFYDTKLGESEVLSLYNNSFTNGTAYQKNVVGNLFYEQGITTITSTEYPRYFSGSLHTGTAVVGNAEKAFFSENFNYMFRNTRRLYEHKYKCATKASDFNLPTNPTLRKITKDGCENIMSEQELHENYFHQAFTPYVTTIGLYDDYGRLLAIGKLARPIKKMKNIDTTFVVRFDT
tara:strand:+ start:535 stop:3825 length:3291 start_codon:yes stop_codon:yes gene_type:complete